MVQNSNSVQSSPIALSGNQISNNSESASESLLHNKTQQQNGVENLIRQPEPSENKVKSIPSRQRDLETIYNRQESEDEQLLRKFQTSKAEGKSPENDLSNALDDLKVKLEEEYHTSNEYLQKQIQELQTSVMRKDEEIAQLQRRSHQV